MHFLQQHAPAKAPRNLSEQPLSRRFFLKSVTAGSGLILGCGALPGLTLNASAAEAAVSTNELVFNAFLTITPDNRVTVVVKHLDMGQGVSTGLTTLVAEELDASWEQMDWESAPADSSRYNNLFWGPAQGTGGSTAIANCWEQLR